jgi:poly(A) polymerase
MTFANLPGVLEEVAPLAGRFAAAGYELYLVGGIVRDQILDRPLDGETDIDLTTDARPDDVKRVISGWAEAVWDQGERFGTVGCSAGGRRYEITTHRSEFYETESRKPAVAFSDDIVSDLSRRDFTVNAMALKLPAGDLIDPYEGQADLTAGVLRTPLTAADSFGDDPLRMLRAARFVSGYGLVPTDDVVDSMVALAERLEIVAVERRRDELDKLVMLPDPTRGLELLGRTGVAAYALPTAADLGAVGARLASLPARLPLRVAALLVDDPGTAERRLADLRFSNEQRRAVLEILEGAIAAPAVDSLSEAAVRRFGFEMGERAGDALELAAQLDAPAVAELSDRLTALGAVEDLAHLALPLDGAQVMGLLGLTEGPEVGEAMEHLLEIRLEQGPLSPVEASALLRAWWADQPRNSSTS